MAKKAKQIEVKFAGHTFVISDEAAKRLLDQLTYETKPAKPIKREVRLTKKFIKGTYAKIKDLGKDLRTVQKEYNRLSDMYENKLSVDDDAWLDQQTVELDAILTAAGDMYDSISR